MNRSFFINWEKSEYQCNECQQCLLVNYDFPSCETCGSHMSYCCLNCSYWFDNTWPEEKKIIEDD